MKKLTALLLALLFSLLAAAPAWAFSDVKPGFSAAIDRVSELGIMTGYPDGTFKPLDSLTRAEFAKVLVSAAEQKLGDGYLPTVMRENNFSDVKVGAWYVDSIVKAENMGLMKGDGDENFRPNDAISEAEAITALLRMLGYDVDNDGREWPDNYLHLAYKLNRPMYSHHATTIDSPCERRYVADLLAWALDLPPAVNNEEYEPTEYVSANNEVKYLLIADYENSDK